MECKKCNGYFPTRATINGRSYNLSSRKYCLACSPFKQNNRQQLEKIESSHNKKCLKYAFKVRIRKKEQAVAYKGGQCKMCGYYKCIAALCFHHTKDKVFNISGANLMKKWEELKIELDKCDLLCCNCHHELHFERNQASLV